MGFLITKQYNKGGEIVLNECISIFEKYADSDVDKLVLDNYIPAEGLYIILEEIEEGFREQKIFEVKQDKKTKEIKNLSPSQMREISELDYYCRLVDMNKAIDRKKIIQSNNYMSFWIKKESLMNGKLTEEIINNYYDILLNPNMKYSKNKDNELYQLIEQEVGPVNQEKLKKIKQWVKDNIFQLPYEITGKDYLKIFFRCNGVSIKQEGKRYILPNIYNKNDYNIKINGEIYGLPNENMGLNSKKPYLESKNRKYKVPVLADTNEIMKRKKFFDYLWGQASKGNYNIYFDSEKNKISPLKPTDVPSDDMVGYYLRIRKDKNEAAILDMDCINAYKPKLKRPFYFDNILDIDTEKLNGHQYGSQYYLIDIFKTINKEIFSNFLLGNLYNEPNEISCNGVLKENILLARNSLINWFFKGYENNVDQIIEKVSFNLIKNSIFNNYMEKVQHQFNFYISMIEYFEGGNGRMAVDMNETRDIIREKINQKGYVKIDTEEEYYYAVGQLIRYFISLNKSSKKMHSLFNPFLTIKKDELLKKRLEGLFIKYNYSIYEASKRFENIYTMVTHYYIPPEGRINHNYLIAGYISKNLIYEKVEGDK
jgi:hypothetical protein